MYNVDYTFRLHVDQDVQVQSKIWQATNFERSKHGISHHHPIRTLYLHEYLIRTNLLRITE